MKVEKVRKESLKERIKVKARANMIKEKEMIKIKAKIRVKAKARARALATHFRRVSARMVTNVALRTRWKRRH